ncbi:MAG: hypothetical protein IPN36_11555 [Bacteroidetes bacterium]|nr:hypothetical protein [Bacteroidota bacterium]MBL0098500.1 hypothetical protein [Bacteroidota bacterium]
MEINSPYFLLVFIITNTITKMTANTINIPKPIPALNIPAIAAHELISVDRNSAKPIVSGLIFFTIQYV